MLKLIKNSTLSRGRMSVGKFVEKQANLLEKCCSEKPLTAEEWEILREVVYLVCVKKDIETAKKNIEPLPSFLRVCIAAHNDDLYQWNMQKHPEDLKVRRSDTDETPLHSVIYLNNSFVVDCLIRGGFDCNERDKNGRTPLMYLAPVIDMNNEAVSIAKILLSAGANMDIKDTHGRTVLEQKGVSNIKQNLLFQIEKEVNCYNHEKNRIITSLEPEKNKNTNGEIIQKVNELDGVLDLKSLSIIVDLMQYVSNSKISSKQKQTVFKQLTHIRVREG